jgi:hypothetical protein
MGYGNIQLAKEKDLESNENGPNAQGQAIDPIVEKSLVKRMDMILLPILCTSPVNTEYKTYLTRSKLWSTSPTASTALTSETPNPAPSNKTWGFTGTSTLCC